METLIRIGLIFLCLALPFAVLAKMAYNYNSNGNWKTVILRFLSRRKH